MWLPVISAEMGPVYLAIAAAIAADIAAGRLRAGDRLPPQRLLADRLGLDHTTVTRAYGEARRRNLVEARVGQGTFVRGDAVPAAPRTAAALHVDMTMNQPPPPDDPALFERLDLAPSALGWMRYPGVAEAEADRAAGLRWLAGRLPGVTAERVVVCPGVQGALTALLTTLTRPGDLICAEDLTYPGIVAAAGQFGLRLKGVAIDRDGIDPDAFADICATQMPRLLYCTPTLHNPTTATMPRARREALVAVARRHGVAIVEDDIYGPLLGDGPPPLAALAPDLVYHVAGLSKCLSPALRLAYLVVPEARQAVRLAQALRATALMPAPLTARLATRWIGDGTAALMLDALRREATARQEMAAARLPAGGYVASRPEAFHLWLAVGPDWTRGAFAAHLRGQGIVLAPADAFAIGGTVPEAVRVCLGAAADRQELGLVLDRLAAALARPAPGATVI